MITIEQRKTSKIPGNISCFISFDYNQEIINIIKNETDVANYSKTTHEWEVPTSNISYLIDRLTVYDDIKFISLKEKKLKKSENLLITCDTSKFKTKPYKYQIDGINFGLNHDSWLLLDAPGLGKTLQMIYLAQELKRLGKIEHCFIICGINTLKINWKKEIEKHSNMTCRILGERINKKGKYIIGSVKDRLDDLKSDLKEDIIITNIETLRDDKIIKELTAKKPKNKFDMVVVDEIHTFKSVTSIQGKHFLKFNQAKYKIGLTGTVLVNSPLDAYVPLKWIGVENSTYTNFKYYYCNFGGPFNNILINYKNIDKLKDQLEQNSLRRTKDILDIPPKNIIHEFIDMEDSQRKFYQDLVDGIVEEADKVEISNTNILSMMIRLRQAIACPSILSSNSIPSAKIDRAVDLTEQMISNNEKVVIFSVFKETLNILNEKLKKYNPLLCTGDIKDTIIADNIDKFQNEDKYKVILCTTAKMGTGITLNAATNAIFIDSPYTSAQCIQCEDRIHRVTNKYPVFIHYLWCNDTIDNRVKQIVDDKSMISDYIVDDKVNTNLIDKLKEIIDDLR